MCETCGTHAVHAQTRADSQSGQDLVVLGEHLLAHNNRAAEHNRAHFDARHLLVLNLMSSPGAGKTALLEATADALKDELRMAVIEGDLETENDAARIRARGLPAVQITTGSACHLDAGMIHDAMQRIDLDALDILFIENVGNLVCPANFDLGQHRNVALLSYAEGDDKPAKYPVLFRRADLVVLTKSDLAPYLDDFDAEHVRRHVRNLGNSAPILSLSAKSGGNLSAWFDWLRRERADRLSLAPAIA
jgi:hydrogenase nickel incorporation protein HypB